MTQPKGKKASQEDKSWQKTKGKADGATLKGNVHQLSGVGLTGKATEEDNKHPLRNTMGKYEKEKNRKPLLKRRKRKRRQNRSVKKERIEIKEDTADGPDWAKEREGI